MLTSADAVRALADALLAEQKPIGFDVETGYMGPEREKGSLYIDWDEQFVCGFSVTNGTGWARYVPVAHDNTNLNVPDAWEIMKPVLETLPTIAHNMRFEKRNLRALERKGRGPSIEVNAYSDSALESYVLSEYPAHGLKFLTNAVFGYEQAEISSLYPGMTKKAEKSLRFNMLELTPEVIDYACDDAVWTLALSNHFQPKIQAHPSRTLMFQIEMRIMELLCDMEDAGHAVDWDGISEAKAYSEPFKEHMTQAARQGLSELAGGIDYSTLNLGSAKQMREALYEQIGLHTTRKTDKGEMSTDAIALERLAKEHVAVKKVLEVREVSNLANRLKKWENEYSIAHDKRVHASFNQVVVASGRFSANDPAIQQLPKEWRWSTLLSKDLNVWEEEHWDALCEKAVFGRHYWGGNFRDFLVAADDCYLLTFDWSQIELRVLAGLSQEPALIEAFETGKDIHTATASQMLGIPYDQVKSKDRAKGKTINFGLVYQMGVDLLADQLAISVEAAEELFAAYFAAFSKVGDWFRHAKAWGTSYEFTETYFGRKVTLWELKSDSFVQRSKGERLCVNIPCQGTAADYAKLSMDRCKQALVERGWWMTKVRMINNLHDALTFEAENDIDPNELRELLKPCVTWEIQPLNFSHWGPKTFPKMDVDWEIGQKWGSLSNWKDETAVFANGQWIVGEPPEAPEPEPELTLDKPEPVVEPVEEDSPPLVVAVNAMPKREQMVEFMELVRQHPGTSPVIFKSPQGTTTLNLTTSLEPSQQPHVSLALGGAEVSYLAEVGIEKLAEGLEL